MTTAEQMITCAICAADMPPSPRACARCGYDPGEVLRLQSDLELHAHNRDWGIVICVVGLVVSGVFLSLFPPLGLTLVLMTTIAGPFKVVQGIGGAVRTSRAIRAAQRPRELPPARVVPR